MIETKMAAMRVPRSRRARTVWRKQVKRRWEDHAWWILIVAAVIALGLGLVGFRRSEPSRSITDAFYRSIQLFFVTAGAGTVAGPTPVSLNVARFLALAVTATAGLRAVFALFGQRAARTWVRYLLRDHVIVCGLGRIGLRVAKAFHEDGFRVVVIEENGQHAAVEECAAEGIVVLIGDAEDRMLLWRAGVVSAQYLVSACGSDGTNARVAVAASDVVRGRRRRHLTCLVHIEEEVLAGLVEEVAFVSESEASCRFQFFNPVQSVPATLLDDFPAFDDPPVAGRAAAVVVVGTGEMGSSLIAHLARRWLAVTHDGQRLRIVAVDDQAERAADLLRVRYPGLERAAELVAHDISVGSPEFDRCAFLPDASEAADVRVYVCIDDDAWGLSAALSIHRKLRGREVPVVVLTTERGGLGSLVGGTDSRLSHLMVFDVLDRTCRPEVLVYGSFEILARVIHRDYVRQEREAGATLETDPDLKDWDDLDLAVKERNRHQAAHIGTMVDYVGCDIEPWTDWDAEQVVFTDEEIESIAVLEHQRWSREREAEGWVYSATRRCQEALALPVAVGRAGRTDQGLEPDHRPPPARLRPPGRLRHRAGPERRMSRCRTSRGRSKRRGAGWRRPGDDRSGGPGRCPSRKRIGRGGRRSPSSTGRW